MVLKGRTGELKTKTLIGQFLDNQYRVFNNIIIRTERGSTQIDHVIVSKYGVFAIETKDKNGWIFGNPTREEWTLVIYNKKLQFQNPLRQNYRHTKSLSEFLGIEHKKIHSLVIFWGDCEFKSPMPDNVSKGGVLGGNFIDYIHSKTTTLLSPDEIDGICSDLVRAKDSTDLLASWHHSRELEERYSSTTICPKCSAALVKRTVSRGQRAGKTTLACNNCHYTRNLDELDIEEDYVKRSRFDTRKKFEESIRSPFPDEWSPARKYLQRAFELAGVGANAEVVEEQIARARELDAPYTEGCLGRQSIIERRQ